jgi:alpha-tubulin suppressor-like RCC1 family protein
VIQVVSGRYHSIAVTASGKVFTWGLNDWGQLGRTANTQQQQQQQQQDQGGEVHGGGADGVCTSGAGCHSGSPEEVTLLAGG